MRKGAKLLETQERNRITSAKGTFSREGDYKTHRQRNPKNVGLRLGVHSVWQTPGLNLKRRWEIQLAETGKQSGNNQDRIWSPLAGLFKRCKPEAVLTSPHCKLSKVKADESSANVLSSSLFAHWWRPPGTGGCWLKDSMALHLPSPHMLWKLQDLALQQE